MTTRRAAVLDGAAAAVLSTFLVISGCATATRHGPYGDTDADVVAAIDRNVTPMAFTVCHGYGCWKRSATGLAAAEWKQVLALFEPAADDAATERARIAEAVALLESAVGRRTGTANDRPHAPFNFGDLEQLDCVDESINTSVYLTLLQRAGLLRWHEPGEPARRGSFLTPFTLPVHFTATVRDRRDGTYYAVDSWFLANGRPPAVVPLALWRAGWMPGDRVTVSASGPAHRR